MRNCSHRQSETITADDNLASHVKDLDTEATEKSKRSLSCFCSVGSVISLFRDFKAVGKLRK